MAPAAIRRANRMPSDSVIAYRELVIPSPKRRPTPDELARRSGGSEREVAISRFIAANRVPRSEAIFYLEEAHMDAASAAALLAEDRAWEAAHPLDPAAFRPHD